MLIFSTIHTGNLTSVTNLFVYTTGPDQTWASWFSISLFTPDDKDKMSIIIRVFPILVLK